MECKDGFFETWVVLYNLSSGTILIDVIIPNFVTREKNQFADALVTLAAWLLVPESGTVKDGDWQKESSLPIAMPWKRRRATHRADKSPWYYDKRFLEDFTVLEGTTADRKTLMRLMWIMTGFIRCKWGTWRSGKSAMKKRIDSGKPPAGPDFPVKLAVVPIVGDLGPD